MIFRKPRRKRICCSRARLPSIRVRRGLSLARHEPLDGLGAFGRTDPICPWRCSGTGAQGRGDRSRRCRLPLGPGLPARIRTQLCRGGCGVRQGDRSLDPNEADAWVALSDVAVLAGRVEEGLEHVRKAFRLNPFPASRTFRRSAKRNMRTETMRPLSRRCAGTRRIGPALAGSSRRASQNSAGSRRRARKASCSSSEQPGFHVDR